MAKSLTRGRAVAAVAGGAALLLGTVVLPAGAASHDVTYALDTGTITVGENTYSLPEATGIEGTWDDVTGDFEGTFTSTPVEEERSITAEIAPGVSLPVNIFLTYEFVGASPVVGNIDPVTGVGSATSEIDVVIKVVDVTIPPSTDRVPVGITCTVDGVNVNYDIAGTDVVPESTLFNNLSLTASGFEVPAPTCVVDPGGNADLLDTVQGAIGDALGVPTSDTAADINLVLGEIPAPPPTTTRPPAPSTTAPQTTCDSIGRTNIPSSDPAYAPHLDSDGDGIACEASAASPARPVAASPRYTG